MAVYRFRVIIEDNDDVYRDIIIQFRKHLSLITNMQLLFLLAMIIGENILKLHYAKKIYL
jgi:hypothetical protein